MNDRIEQLLIEADRRYTQPMARSSDVADRVLETISARRTRRRAAAATMIVIIASTLALFVLNRNNAPSIARVASSPPAVVDYHEELAAHSASLQELLIAERLSNARQQLQKLQTLEAPQSPVDRAAFVLIAQADRLMQTSRASAEQKYRDVIRYFPNTAPAELAQERLAELSKQG